MALLCFRQGGYSFIHGRIVIRLHIEIEFAATGRPVIPRPFSCRRFLYYCRRQLLLEASLQVQGAAEIMAPPEKAADGKYLPAGKMPGIIEHHPGQLPVLLALRYFRRMP